jgi:hypothetical protein
VAPKLTATALEAFPYRETGMVCLVVSSNEDHDTWLSELNACDDFATEDLETRYSQRAWVYSMWLASDDDVYIAHSGKVLRRGPLDAPEIVLTHDRDITRLCGAARGVYIVGLDGYVGHYDGATLHDLPVPDAEVFHVAEAADGTLYPAANRGRVFRRDRDTWHPMKVADGGDIRHLAADGEAMLFAGATGVCGRLQGETITRFSAPADRDFFAITRFHGRVFVGAGRRGLDVVENDAVVSFKDNVYSFKLWANDAYLFATGLNEAARFDGESWVASEFTH